MNLRVHRVTMIALTLGMFLETLTLGTPNLAAQKATPFPERQIDLTALNFKQPQAPNYKNGEVFSNLSLLFQDVHAHVEFIVAKELVVYFSDLVDERVTAQKGQPPTPPPPHTMEALFLDVENGNLISHQVWQTRERRFFNTRYDTQARIMPVRDGFLVHANNTLSLYTPDLQKKREIQLDPSLEYAAMVAPRGEVFFLEQSNPGVVSSSGGVSMVVNGDSEHWPVAHGEWRSSETFEKVRSIDLFPGSAESVSTDAFAGEWYKCIDVERADATRTHLCCGDPCRYGLPMFLTSDQILAEIRSGFQVLSSGGELLWERQNADWSSYDIYDYMRSLEGSRFAMLILAYRKLTLDDTLIPKRWFAVLVYDRSRRSKVFSVVLKSENAPAIALSPSGDRLAILSGTTVLSYRIPPD